MAWGTADGIPGRKSAGSIWISGKGGAMRLSWKLFFITTPIFVLFLTIFGIWIIQDSFDHSLSQAVEQCMAENQTFQNSYELTNHALSEAQWNQTTIKKVVASFHKSREAGDGNARIYDSDGSILYEDNALALKLERTDTEGTSGEKKRIETSGQRIMSELTEEEIEPKQHFTQPPAHFTEASLVKTLEELGIGRPSTYAPTITTILGRRYIVKENKNLYVSELGEVVNNIMKEAFPEIVDERFTANMESLLDKVEEGTVDWKMIIRNFYPDLDAAVKAAEAELEKVKIEDEVTDVVCEQCGRHMVIKYGPHGRFLACPGFPECRNTKPYFEKIGVTCPKCGKDIVLKKTKKGRKYYGCENNPECDFMSWQKPSKVPCPQCGGYMVEKGNKLVCADEQCGYVMEKPETSEE